MTDIMITWLFILIIIFIPIKILLSTDNGKNKNKTADKYLCPKSKKGERKS
jgi:hypothetical protein